jgi:ADP-ribose pyrophosphatase YjhB (NUDIX family)
MEPGLWGIPGGRVEPGEALCETVLAETGEECGYVPGLAVESAPFDEWRAPDGDFVYYTFRASVPAEFVPTLNWESDDYRWAKPADAARDPGVHHNVRRVLAGLEVDQKDVKCGRGRRRFNQSSVEKELLAHKSTLFPTEVFSDAGAAKPESPQNTKPKETRMEMYTVTCTTTVQRKRIRTVLGKKQLKKRS